MSGEGGGVGVRKSEGTAWLGQTPENTETSLRRSDSVRRYWEDAGDFGSLSISVDYFF